MESNSLNMDTNFDSENTSSNSKKRRKKHFNPYKKDKYTLSKLKEYKKYLDYLEMVRSQGNLEY